LRLYGCLRPQNASKTVSYVPGLIIRSVLPSITIFGTTEVPIAVIRLVDYKGGNSSSPGSISGGLDGRSSRRLSMSISIFCNTPEALAD